jgi:hypothetical protein
MRVHESHTEVKVEREDAKHGEASEELLEYLHTE